MYTSSDDEDCSVRSFKVAKTPVALEPQSHPNGSESTSHSEHVSPVTESEGTVAVPDMEWRDMPESYLERCAVLVDIMPLADPEFFESRTTAPVEGKFVVVRYPFCGLDANTVQSNRFVFQPTVKALNMTAKDKKLLIGGIVTRVREKHGVPPYLVGIHNEKRGPLRTYEDRLRLVSVQPACASLVLCSDKKREELIQVLNTVIAQAVANCGDSDEDKGDGLANARGSGDASLSGSDDTRQCEKAIAFLTTHDRQDDVRFLLSRLGPVFGVQLPKYRVFTLDEVLGKGWAGLMPHFMDRMKGSARCPFHRVVSETEGGAIHCCNETVEAIHAVVQYAARALAESEGILQTE